MGHYDDCREAATWQENKKKAYDYYEKELNQLGSAVELIKAIANGYGENDGECEDGWKTKTPRQACDRWLMDNGYECEATRQAQKAKRRSELDNQIKRLRKEREDLDK